MPPTCPHYLIVALLDLCSALLALRSARYLCLLFAATYCGLVCGPTCCLRPPVGYLSAATLPAARGLPTGTYPTYLWLFISIYRRKGSHKPATCLLLVPCLFIWSKIRPVAATHALLSYFLFYCK
ncbi:hypothetical protein O6H91_16G060400 [Diphasiastrum complanatum]|uniref:Uncharacterized protein n=1 Tax=Diphasiastrum complanatum TaxID=34168 RepID=A0ACC2BCV2_DIPCM|nr:hypothetical protein O6H91_16G060400 [Diphasiastrum complanatum]